MVDIEIFLRFVVDINLKLRNFIFSFGGDEKVVGGVNLEFFALIIICIFLHHLDLALL